MCQISGTLFDSNGVGHDGENIGISTSDNNEIFLAPFPEEYDYTTTNVSSIVTLFPSDPYYQGAAWCNFQTGVDLEATSTNSPADFNINWQLNLQLLRGPP